MIMIDIDACFSSATMHNALRTVHTMHTFCILSYATMHCRTVHTMHTFCLLSYWTAQCICNCAVQLHPLRADALWIIDKPPTLSLQGNHYHQIVTTTKGRSPVPNRLFFLTLLKPGGGSNSCSKFFVAEIAFFWALFGAIIRDIIRNIDVQKRGGGSKAVWTMLKKTDDLAREGVP